MLLEHVPREVRRGLDLGTGGGRLLALLQRERPHLRGTGLDSSKVDARCRASAVREPRTVELVEHYMTNPLPKLGCFDAVVSSKAIHHLEHDRERELYAEVFKLPEPGGRGRRIAHAGGSIWRSLRAIGEPLEHELVEVAADRVGRVLAHRLVGQSDEVKMLRFRSFGRSDPR